MLFTWQGIKNTEFSKKLNYNIACQIKNRNVPIFTGGGIFYLIISIPNIWDDV